MLYLVWKVYGMLESCHEERRQESPVNSSANLKQHVRHKLNTKHGHETGPNMGLKALRALENKQSFTADVSGF